MSKAQSYEQVPLVGYQQVGGVPQQQTVVMVAGGVPQQQAYAYADASWQKPTIPVQGEPLFDSGDAALNQHFRVDGYKDVWAMVLFYISFIATIVVCIINVKNDKINVRVESNGNADSAAATFGKAAGAGLGFAVVLTIILLALMKAFARQFIWIANGFVILLFIAYAGFGFSQDVPVMGVFGIIFALLTALWLYCIRHRIPFSALLLETSTDCVMRFHGTVVCAFVMLAFTVAYFIPWALMTVPTVADMTGNSNGNGTTSSSAAYWVFLIFLLMLFWFQTTSAGVTHVTTSGAVATWYFVGDGQMPGNPTLASFKRAMTTSFGSIAFGSLIIAILKVIEAIARSAYRQNRNSIGACIAYCIISCIERLMEYFCVYAFSHIAIYGCSFVEAASLTWQFIQHSVWTAVINDILVERVFILLTIFEMCAIGAINYAIFKSWLAVIAGVLVALIVSAVVFRTVDSGVITLMVCVAEHPDIFVAKHPVLSQKLHHAIGELRKGCCDESADA